MSFKFTKMSIPEVVLVESTKHKDDRGFFTEAYRLDAFPEEFPEFVQDNVSVSSKGTLRGLHYQDWPKEQSKLVTCIKGYIIDVAVDIREFSDTFGQYVKVELFGPGTMLFVPAGFAHGFLALEDDTIVSYKCSEFYSSEHDRNIRWNDPQINIDWDFDLSQVKVSDKDNKAPLLKDADLA